MKQAIKELLLRATIGVCVLFGIAPLASIAWYCWDSARNRDFEFGYFGVFNRVHHALTEIPEVTITDHWANHDITLEEFGFYVTTGDGRTLHLSFPESDPLRGFPREQLKAELPARIQWEARRAQLVGARPRPARVPGQHTTGPKQ